MWDPLDLPPYDCPLLEHALSVSDFIVGIFMLYSFMSFTRSPHLFAGVEKMRLAAGRSSSNKRSWNEERKVQPIPCSM
jgi:hypothetical protein